MLREYSGVASIFCKKTFFSIQFVDGTHSQESANMNLFLVEEEEDENQ
jgi:hypothetical protein